MPGLRPRSVYVGAQADAELRLPQDGRVARVGDAVTWPDMANAGFELLGGAMLWLTVLATYRAKRVVGVAIPTVLFFVAWDVWFLCFYWQLAQWASFVAGLWLTAAQATWLGQMVYYR